MRHPHRAWGSDQRLFQVRVRRRSPRPQGSNGTYTWTFVNAVPADATGTWVVGLEAYRNMTLLPGTTQEQTAARCRPEQAVLLLGGRFAGPAAAAGREHSISATAATGFLSLHGGNRNTVEECVLCHNPNTTDANNRPKTSCRPDRPVCLHDPPHSHRRGRHHGRRYGNGGSNDFGEVRYPGDRRNCNACHVNGSEQLPLQEGLQNVKHPRRTAEPDGTDHGGLHGVPYQHAGGFACPV